MIKKQRSKEMTGAEANVKQKATGEYLICVRECVAPGYGAWKAGDTVTDPKLVQRFYANPNFEVKEG